MKDKINGLKSMIIINRKGDCIMISKGYGDRNMSVLSTYYMYEAESPFHKEWMENCFREEDPKKFKEFLEWKEEMERIHPYGKDAILGKKAPPLNWEFHEDPVETSFLKNIFNKIKIEVNFLLKGTF